LRGCTWKGEVADRFDVNVLEPNSGLPNDLRRAVLGSRRHVIFVEGNNESLDRRIYQLLIDGTIYPKGSCVDVIHAVDGLRGAEDLHWVHAFGLIDQDNRSADEITELRAKGIFAIPVCSVEALFFGSVARTAIAIQQAQNLGRKSADLLTAAEAAAFSRRGLEAGQKCF
jgi:hypothetical protein